MVLKSIEDVRREADCLHAAEEVDAALAKMAEEITEVLGGKNPVAFCVMNGGLFVTGKLVERLPFPLELDYLHATRYGAETSGGNLHWKVRPERTLKGRTILLVDDILDEGCDPGRTDPLLQGRGGSRGIYRRAGRQDP